jgi:DNA polymerase III delta prime subunit
LALTHGQSFILPLRSARDVTDFVRQLFPNSYIMTIAHHQKQQGVAVGVFVEDIRELLQNTRTSSRQPIVVVINDAARMTLQAQNALLKTLEEPPAHLSLLLASSSPHTLLPTILSRCQLLTEAVDEARNIAIPSDRHMQIMFFAAGDSEKIARLSSDNAYFQRTLEIFTQAKTLVGGTMNDKLAVVTTLKDSRERTLEVVDAALKICEQQIMNGMKADLIPAAEMFLQARDNLTKNANVRLQLLACMV